ncbi:MAG: helix-turn-helix domain-containing protein, partial [Defluviitaleaceae bacterium]|nr:helix-turn-helix domain-containing protein [Defluviitaleaceae bacterium]
EGREVSSKTIYKQIWGADMNNDTSALRQQISRLKKKIGEETAEKFSINNEHGRGYIFTSS